MTRIKRIMLAAPVAATMGMALTPSAQAQDRGAAIAIGPIGAPVVYDPPPPIVYEPSPPRVVYEQPRVVYEPPPPVVYEQPRAVYEERPRVYEPPPRVVYERPRVTYEGQPRLVYEPPPRGVLAAPPPTYRELRPAGEGRWVDYRGRSWVIDKDD